jgi:hypothetical protein
MGCVVSSPNVVEICGQQMAIFPGTLFAAKEHKGHKDNGGLRGGSRLFGHAGTRRARRGRDKRNTDGH